MVWKELERQEARRSSFPAGGFRAESAREALIGAIFGDRAPPEAAQLLASCSVHWPDLAGELAPHCRPLRVAGGRLFVECDHGVFAQELQFRAAARIERIQHLPGGSVVNSLQIRSQISEDHGSA